MSKLNKKERSGNSSENNGNNAAENQVVTEEQTVTTHPVGKSFIPHPLSKLVPARSQKDKDVLVEDIKLHGLINPGIMYEGMLLDGNERNEACIRAKVPFRTVEFQGDSPAIFVLTTHCQNRKLNVCHRAVLAAKTANLSLGSNQHTGSGSAKLQTLISVEAAAKMVDVSPRYVESAKAVLSYSGKLIDAACAGKISLSLAEGVAKHIKHPEEVERLLEEDNPKKALTELLASVISDEQNSLEPKKISLEEACQMVSEWNQLKSDLLQSTRELVEELAHEASKDHKEYYEKIREVLMFVFYEIDIKPTFRKIDVICEKLQEKMSLYDAKCADDKSSLEINSEDVMGDNESDVSYADTEDTMPDDFGECGDDDTEKSVDESDEDDDLDTSDEDYEEDDLDEEYSEDSNSEEPEDDDLDTSDEDYEEDDLDEEYSEDSDEDWEEEPEEDI